jgi:hypothetical protein
MEKPFKLPILYQGKIIDLDARIVFLGYHYQFKIVVNQFELVFEYDERERFTVVHNESSVLIEKDLIVAITNALQGLESDFLIQVPKA